MHIVHKCPSIYPGKQDETLLVTVIKEYTMCKQFV